MAKFNATELGQLRNLLERYQQARDAESLVRNWLQKDVSEKMFISPKEHPNAKLTVTAQMIADWIAAVAGATDDIERQIDRIFVSAREREANEISGRGR